MPRKGYSPEEIVTKLRQAEVELGRGVRTPLVCKKLGVSEQPYYRWRREYGGLRLEQAKRLKELEREHTRHPRLVTRLIALASDYGRYGYRRVTALLHREGWHVNHKRVARLWRREGLKVPQQQVTRGRLWLADGSCIRQRPTYRHHVQAYDFVADRTTDGRPLKVLAVVDEYSRECLALVVTRRLRATDVLEALAVQTLFIAPGSPWENGYVESFNGKLRDELLARETFTTLTEARILIERWRREYNTVRPHSALGYRPPAPEAVRPMPARAPRVSWALS